MDPKTGYIKAEFDLSDSIGEFTIQIDAFSSNGFLGSFKSFIHSERPFYLNYDLPTNLILTDELKPVVFVHNKTVNKCDVEVEVEGFQGISYDESPEVKTAAEETKAEKENLIVEVPEREIKQAKDLLPNSIIQLEFMLAVRYFFIYYIYIYILGIGNRNGKLYSKG